MSETKVIQKKYKLSNEHQSTESNSSVVEEADGDFGQIGQHLSKASVTISRDEYLQAHRELTHDYQQLKIKNNLLHRRLGEYYKKRKLEHVLKPLENSGDLEEKYQQKLYVYEELKDKEEREINDIKSKIEAVKLEYSERHQCAVKKFDELQHLEKSTSTGLIYSKKGKPISEKTVQRLLFLQKHKIDESSGLCLRYIRVRNAVLELETVVRRLETLGPGLHVAKYEQMYIDKQNYVSKIEERDDELIKHRNKCTEHNQILAHIREKMHHTDEVIDFTEGDLGDAEIEFLKAREELGLAKNQRDRLRWCLESERLKAGLLTRKDLLRDYQDATDEVVKLKRKKQLLTNQISNIKKELRDARHQTHLQRPEMIEPNGVKSESIEKF